VRQLAVNATASECSSACSTGFNDPMLVGFGTRINSSDSCYCYFSGGVAPSIIPPQGYHYQKYNHAGNGPIMKTRQRADWNCFVYAQVRKLYFSFHNKLIHVRSYCTNDHLKLMGVNLQGTGSPTVPGATHAPITPSPTGSTTHAPTPVGIATYIKVGSGFCRDSSNESYNEIDGLSGINIFDELLCSQFCGQFPSSNLVGFSHFRGGSPSCYCHYSGQVPAPPSGSDWNTIRTLHNGTGPISRTNGNDIVDCYAFPQVIKLTFQPLIFLCLSLFLVVLNAVSQGT